MICRCCYKTIKSSYEVIVNSNVRRLKDKSYTVKRCDSCLSLLRLEAIDYRDAYKDYPLQKQTMDWFTKKIFSKRLSHLKKHGLVCDSFILDYGCGVGHFVEYLEINGYTNVFGFDEYVQKFQNREIFSNIKFDYILLQDVIEHVPNPLNLICEIKNKLKPLGVIVIGTPNAEKISLQNSIHHSWVLHQPFHENIFSQNQLEILLVTNNFKIIESTNYSYIDTIWPAVNTHFLAYYIHSLGGYLDSGFEPINFKILFIRPKLMLYLFLGYWLRDPFDMVIVVRNSTKI